MAAVFGSWQRSEPEEENASQATSIPSVWAEQLPKSWGRRNLIAGHAPKSIKIHDSVAFASLNQNHKT